MIFNVLGNDERQFFLKEHIEKAGHTLVDFDKVNEAEAVIFPIPFKKNYDAFIHLLEIGYSGVVFGGLITKNAYTMNTRAELVDYTEIEYFSRLNAVPSAEGAVFEIMSNTKKTILGTEVLMFGYGRIAQHMTRLLVAFGAKVTVCARKSHQRANAEALGVMTCDFGDIPNVLPNADVIVNTVPEAVLKYDNLLYAKKDVFLLDLASAPGGISVADAAKCGLSVDWALSLPSKYSPDTAAKYILLTVEDYLANGEATHER